MNPSLDTHFIEAACQRLVLRSAALSDAGRASELAGLFTADGVLVRPSGDILHGRHAIEASYAPRPAERITRHLVSNILVDIASATQASASSCVLLWTGTTLAESGRFGRPAQGPQVVGDFDDRFLLTAGGWRIAHRTARFVLHAAS